MPLPPLSPHVPIVDERGRPTPEFLQWWQQQRTVNATNTLDTALKVSAALDEISGVQGSLLYRDSSNWNALAPGVAGRFLKTQGAGANPVWDVSSGGATVFTGLTDVPASYTGHGGKTVTVKAAEDGLEFIAGGGGAGLSYRQLLDLDDYSPPVQADFGVTLSMPSAAATITDVATGVRIVSTSGTEPARTIIAKTVPTNWRAVVVGMRDLSSGVTFKSPGLVLWRTGHASFVTVGMGTNGAGALVTRVLQWNATTGVFIMTITDVACFGSRMFYRVSRGPDGALTVWHSPDGVAWIVLNTGNLFSTMGGNLTHFGISATKSEDVIFHAYLDDDVHP